MHGGAGDSGALGMVPLVTAVAGGGISGGGRAELLAPDSGIFCHCGWVEEGSVVPPGESEAPGDRVSPSGCGARGGPVACEGSSFCRCCWL